MVSSLRILSLAATAAVVTLGTLAPAEAHSYMKFPPPKFQPGHWGGHWYAQVNGGKFNASEPLYKGRARIAEILAASGDTVRKFMMDNMDAIEPLEGRTPTKECGFTLLDGARQPVPDHIAFPWVHPGPCEIWCDNTRVFYDVECQGNQVANVTIDKAKCAGTSVLQAMYVAVHAPPMWQVFTNCIALDGGDETDASRVLDTNARGDGGADVGGEALPRTTPSPPPPSPRPNGAPAAGPPPSTPASAVPTCRRRHRA